MAWVLREDRETQIPFVQWVDPDKAAGWSAECRRLAALPLPAPGMPRVERTRELLHALGQFSRSVDLPAFVLAPYALRLLGSDPGPQESRLPGIAYPVGIWDAALQAAMVRVNSRIQQRVGRGYPYRLTMRHRCGLTSDGGVMMDLATADLPPDLYGTDEIYRVCPSEDASGGIWACWHWREWWPGITTPGEAGEVVALVPLGRHYELARSACAEVGVNWQTALRNSRLYVAAVNLRTARAIGAALPEDIARIAAEWQLTPTGPEMITTLFGAGATAVGAILAIAVANPLVGAVIGVVAGIPAVLLELVGRASQGFVDVWGRRVPLIESPRLTGSVSPVEQPSHEVEEPPEWERPPAYTPFIDLNFDIRDIRVRRPEAKKGGTVKVIAAGFLAWLLTRGG